MTRFPRTAVLAAAALAVVTTAGCSMTNPPTTAKYYMPSDGVEAVLGANVVVSQVLVVAEDQDSPGALVARVANQGSETANVRIASEDGAVDVDVRVQPGETYAIGGEDDDEQVLLEPVGRVPGQSIPMTASLDDGQSQQMLVPVLDGTLQEYADLLPQATQTL